jgi:very-short-patch-repair endonuclease
MRVKRDNNRRLTGFARQMRHEPTDAERKMWGILRDRQLQGFKFRRQYPIAGYILDFYCVHYCLAIELDGGQHGDSKNLKYDEQRTRELQGLGVRVLRFWDDEVLKYPDVVAERVLNELEMLGQSKKPSPRPSPGVPGEGEERK